MSLTKTFGAAAATQASGTALTTGTFDSTGYTHIVVFFKHEGGPTTLTPSDNKGSSSWTSLTKESHSGGEPDGQFFWAPIGTPGTGHTATVTPSASRAFRGIIAWLVSATGGTIELDAETTAEGSSAAPDAGSLSTTGVSVVSFFGLGLYNIFNATAASGWTEDLDGSNNYGYAGYSRAAETTTPINPAATWAISDRWACCAASFREPAAGGGGLRRKGSLALQGVGR
jgi:hypothetical protein